MDIKVDPAKVPLSAEALASLTSQVHDTLGELSPEFRVRLVEVDDDVSAGGGRYQGGTTLLLSPWAVPMSSEDRTALAKEMYGEDNVPSWVSNLNNISHNDQLGALQKAIRHESGHYIENQLRLRTKGSRWWRDWSNEIAPRWEAESEQYFREELFPPARMYESNLTRRRNPLFYTAATHGWSGDTDFEGSLRGVESERHRNAELFAEFVSFDLAGESFPNGDIVGRHIRQAVNQPGVAIRPADVVNPAFSDDLRYPKTRVAFNPGMVDADDDGYAGEDEAAGIRGTYVG